jgi:hypothetical protein
MTAAGEQQLQLAKWKRACRDATDRISPAGIFSHFLAACIPYQLHKFLDGYTKRVIQPQSQSSADLIRSFDLLRTESGFRQVI